MLSIVLITAAVLSVDGLLVLLIDRTVAVAAAVLSVFRKTGLD